MSESKHTPRPWYIEKRLLGSGWLFRLGQAPFKDEDEAEANRQLMEVAPDLLAALEKIAKTFENDSRDTLIMYQIAKLAITKATKQ